LYDANNDNGTDNSFFLLLETAKMNGQTMHRLVTHNVHIQHTEWVVNIIIIARCW